MKIEENPMLIKKMDPISFNLPKMKFNSRKSEGGYRRSKLYNIENPLADMYRTKYKRKYR